MTFQNRHHQAQLWFTDKFHQIFKKEIVAILSSLSQNTEAEGEFLTLSSVTLTQKPDDAVRKLQTNFPHKHRCKIINKY